MERLYKMRHSAGKDAAYEKWLNEETEKEKKELIEKGIDQYKNDHLGPWIADSPIGAVISAWEQWKGIPDDIKRKIISNYKEHHPGDTRSDLEIERYIAMNISWVVWCELTTAQTYISPNGGNKLFVPKGFYFLGYQLYNDKPHLFWGPGYCSWSHSNENIELSTDNLIGKEYSGSTVSDGGAGNRNSAWALIGSWGLAPGFGGQSAIRQYGFCRADKVVLGIFGYALSDVSPHEVITDYVVVEISRDGSVKGIGPGMIGSYSRGCAYLRGGIIDGYENSIRVLLCIGSDYFGMSFDWETGSSTIITDQAIIYRMLGIGIDP
jgi:hypothetical protein